MIIVLGIFGVIVCLVLYFNLMCVTMAWKQNIHISALARSCVPINAMAYKHIFIRSSYITIYLRYSLFSRNVRSFSISLFNIIFLSVWFSRKLVLCYGTLNGNLLSHLCLLRSFLSRVFVFVSFSLSGWRVFFFCFSPTKLTLHNGTWKLD